MICRVYCHSREKVQCENAFYMRATSTGFGKQAVGHNTLERIIKDLMLDAGICGFFTLYSLRATAATRLYNNGMDEQAIMHITGHRSAAVREYKRMEEGMKRHLSAILHTEEPQEISEKEKPSGKIKIEDSSTSTNDDSLNISQGSQKRPSEETMPISA